MNVPKPQHKRRKPKRKERGSVNKKQYQLAIEWFGDTCTICNSSPIELHHVQFRSAGGRNNYRNLMPLCKTHHDMAHADRNFADELRDERAFMFGKLYYTDRFDLHDAGLIDEPTEELYEQYMNEMGKFR